ncbi:MAG TPA: hypothetical protein VEC57_14400 [Candidatus Limnocylindrales bacterium]|nr:hypothetical protein [Candidatus Limnocylindrales bacterium]
MRDLGEARVRARGVSVKSSARLVPPDCGLGSFHRLVLGFASLDREASAAPQRRGDG